MPNIFQQYLTAPKSVMEYSADLDQADARKQSLQQNALTLAAGRQKFEEGQQARQRSAQLRSALTGLPQGATDEQRIQAMRATGLPEGFAAADSLSKSLIDQQKGKAAAAKDQADAEKTNLARDIALHDFHAQKLAMVQSPEDALAWAQEGQALGLFKQPGQYDRGVSMIQQAAQDPQAFAKWKAAALQGGQSVTEQLKQQFEAAKQAEQVRQFGITEKRIVSEGAADRAVRRDGNAATRDMAKATRDAAVIRRDQDTEMKLADDYRNQSKAFKETSDAYKQLNATLDKAATSPSAALAGATKFMKLLDPGSVVRESELGMALAATGLLDRATNYVEHLKHGKVLTPAQVADFKKTTLKIYEAAQDAQRTIDASYRNQAKTYGLRPEVIIQDLGQNVGTPPAPAAATDVRARADAILGGK